MSGLSTTQAGSKVYDRELTVVYVPTDIANASSTATLVNSTIEAIARAGFEVCSMDIEGSKTLAFPIESKYGEMEKKGIFAYFTLCGNGSAFKLSTALNAEKKVLRYLLVTVK